MKSTPPSIEGRRRLSPFWLQVITIGVLVILWEIAGRTGLILAYKYSYPSDVLLALYDLVVDGFPNGVRAFGHVEATFTRIILGFLLASICAIPLGLLLGRLPFVLAMVDPLITFARSMAVISLLPLAIALFGVGETARVALIFYACFWIVLSNAIQGAAQVDPLLLNVGRSLGLTRFQLFARVFLPAALPMIFAGMRVAVGMAFMVIVAVEMVGTVEGLGALISQARTFYRTPIAISGMVLIGLVGFLIAVGMAFLERWLMPWSRSQERKS
ncbi:MAG: ABC transporter permease [Pseudomonadota bacterium]|nr:ABC transporter permease [Pseudomonadota bacterium]